MDGVIPSTDQEYEGVDGLEGRSTDRYSTCIVRAISGRRCDNSRPLSGGSTPGSRGFFEGDERPNVLGGSFRRQGPSFDLPAAVRSALGC